MTDLVFFYGTLMSGFKRPGRARLDHALKPIGRGWIDAALFDLGIYPAAIPAQDTRVRGEVHQMLDPDAVLNTLDEIEGYRSMTELCKDLDGLINIVWLSGTRMRFPISSSLYTIHLLLTRRLPQPTYKSPTCSTSPASSTPG